MSKNKCCGNCARFFNEDAKGNGFCSISPNRQVVTYRHNTCIAHEWKLPKWTEITPDNENEVYNIQPNRLVIAWEQGGMTVCRMLQDISPTISTMAKIGGYYYMELPELKLE